MKSNALIFLSFAIVPFLSIATSIKSNTDVNKQINGDFGLMTRAESLPLGAIQHAWDKTNNRSGIYEVEYRSNSVIKIRVREHMVSTISLPKWEKIEKVLVGDEGIVRATIPKHNIVILEPQDFVGTDTSVTIIGQGHTYILYVRLEGYNSKSIPDIGVTIKAHPPQGFLVKNKLNKQKTLRQDYLQRVLTKPEDLSFDFSMAGDKSIAPKIVYSDGIRTWLYYGKHINKTRLPAVYSVIDGVDVPSNSTRIKNSIVVQGDGFLTLKNGAKVVCVYPTHLGRHYK